MDIKTDNITALLREQIARWKRQGVIPKDAVPDDDPLGWLVHEDVDSVISAGYKFAAEPSSISTVLTGTASVEHLKMNVESMKEPSLIEDHMDRLKATLSHIIEYA